MAVLAMRQSAFHVASIYLFLYRGNLEGLRVSR